MPALTVKAVTKALSEYVRPDEDLVAKLNLVMPRLYGMGMWKDLLYDWSIDTTNDYFALPEHSESLLGAMLQDSPVQARSQWHDYRIGGYAKSGPAPIFGVVDDGFHEAKEDLSHKAATDIYYITVEPIAPKTTLPTSGSVTVVYGEENDFAVGEDDVESHTFDLNGTASLSTLVNKVVSIKSVSFADVSEEVKVSAVASTVSGSHLTFKLIGSDLNGNNGKWRGIANGGDKLFCPPYHEDFLLVIDPVTDTTSNGGAVANPEIGSKLVDTLNASDGFIYANPSGYSSYLKINPSAAGTAQDPYISVPPSSPQPNDSYLGYNPEHLRGGAEINGNIYSSVYSRGATITNGQVSTPYVVKFDIDATSTTNHVSPWGRTELPINFPTDSDGNRTGGIYDVRPNWVSEIDDISTSLNNFRWVYDSYIGATKAANGKIYLTPYGADKIVIVNPTNDSVTVGSDLITGNEPYYTGTINSNITIHHPYWNKYSGGTFVPSNGCIYCFPRHANAILKIDTSNDTATEIPLPAALRIRENTYFSGTSSEVDVYFNKSFSSVLGPDGIVYSVPFEIPYIFWIDPATDEIGYKEISAELTGSGAKTNSATDSWYSYGAVHGNSIYMAPQKANYVMKMSVPPREPSSVGGVNGSRRYAGNTSSTTTLAVVKGDGVARYRRFRFSNPSAEVKNIKLLLKRSWEPVLVQDDLIYLGNLNAIKHGLLGMLAEDNADLERAQYHWTICQKLLDEELDAARGSAKPRVSLDPSGSGSTIPNIM